MLAYSFYEQDNRVRRYAETLVRHGYEVDVIALRKMGQARRGRLNNVAVFRIQQRARDEKNKFSYLFKLWAFLVWSTLFLSWMHLRRRYDLVHVHSIPDFEVFAAVVPKITGAKIILDVHDIVPELYASKFRVAKESMGFKALLWIEKLSIAFSDHVIIANHIWERTLLSRTAAKGKCTTVLNYPDPAVFFHRPRTAGNNGKFVIIYPGTINWHQGLDIAVEALAEIKDDCPGVELHVYGDGPTKKAIERLVAQRHLQDRIFFKSPLPLERMAVAMAEADLGIVPKRNDIFGGDAFSTKILEFMALGVPIVVSGTRIDRYYFNSSLVEFFEAEDSSALAQALKKVIASPDLREQLARNAQTFVADYMWDKRQGDYLSLVDRLVYGRTAEEPVRQMTASR